MLHVLAFIAAFPAMLLLHALFRLYRVSSAKEPLWTQAWLVSARLHAGAARIVLVKVQFQMLKVSLPIRPHPTARYMRPIRFPPRHRALCLTEFVNRQI